MYRIEYIFCGMYALNTCIHQKVSIDNFRTALFISLYISLFRYVYSKTTNEVTSSLISSISLYIETEQRKWLFSMQFFIRAIYNKISVNKYTRSLLFGFINIPIVYAGFYQPRYFSSKTYYQFILKLGNIKDEDIENHCRNDKHIHYHKGTCYQYLLSELCWGFIRSCNLYAMLYGTSSLIMHKKIHLKSYVKNVFFSSLFVTSYIASIKTCLCYIPHINNPLYSIVIGLLTSFSTLWEYEMRTAEISIYCAYQSVMIIKKYFNITINPVIFFTIGNILLFGSVPQDTKIQIMKKCIFA